MLPVSTNISGDSFPTDQDNQRQTRYETVLDNL